jgi:hypothetical protein
VAQTISPEDVHRIAREKPHLKSAGVYAEWVDELFARYEQEACIAWTSTAERLESAPRWLLQLVTPAMRAGLFESGEARRWSDPLDASPLRSEMLTEMVVRAEIADGTLRAGAASACAPGERRLFLPREARGMTRAFAARVARLDSRIQGMLAQLCADRTLTVKSVINFYKHRSRVNASDSQRRVRRISWPAPSHRPCGRRDVLARSGRPLRRWNRWQLGQATPTAIRRPAFHRQHSG